MSKQEIINQCHDFLENILNSFEGLEYKLDIYEEPNGNVNFQIQGENLGRIIGKEGNVLYALQTILLAYLRKLSAGPIGFEMRVDANNYQRKHESSLRKMVHSIINEVNITGVSQRLEPMPFYDRLFIHKLIGTRTDVESHSEGIGNDRSVVITKSVKEPIFEPVQEQNI